MKAKLTTCSSVVTLVITMVAAMVVLVGGANADATCLMTSVKDFGAVGDGVTDDTAGIQNAVNYASCYSTKLFFPRGTYKVTAQINIPVATTMIDIDGGGAAILPSVGSSGSVFRASHPMVDYQSAITIKNFVVTSTVFDSATIVPIQARAFVEFNGGGFINATVENIKSTGVVCLGAVVWFSDVNYGFADGITVQNVNFGYAAQTAFAVAITKRADGSTDARNNVHAHSRFINLFNKSNSNAVNFGSWSTRGSGEQGCILLDGVQLEDTHIGPFCIGNPYVILGKNGAILARSTIEATYSELEANWTVFGSYGEPVSIKCNLDNCMVQAPRLYYNATSFAGTARIYSGKAINTKFEKPAVMKVGSVINYNDVFITFATGSSGNYVDRLALSSVVNGTTDDSYAPHPSQHVQGPAGASKYNNFREAGIIQPSVALGSTYSANGYYLVATIPACNLNANDIITIRGSVYSAGASGCNVVRLVAIIGGSAASSTPYGTVNSSNEVSFEMNLHFVGGTDKAYAPSVSYWGTNKMISEDITLTNSNNGASSGPVDIASNNMTVWLHTDGLVDPVKLTGLTIEHRSGNFQWPN